MDGMTVSNNKRIAKNTLFLYFRTLLVMLVSLYTSRVVLDVLGVENFGIYNVVGGAVAMFGVISGALSNAISRFITYELGKGNSDRLNAVFSTSVNVQIVMTLIIFVLGETIGIWFLYSRMQIPIERMNAAFWVLQCSLITFGISLLSVPYNACITAHEHMKFFAYISIWEIFSRLGICYLVNLSPWDNLISYAILLVVIAVLTRFVYGMYCHKNFLESHYKFSFDKNMMKDIGSFAGWNFFISGATLFNTHGVNLLVNSFFGVSFNAARGIALQMESAITRFVDNFSVAINPQITKSYAEGKLNEMFSLVCRGTRFSYLLFLFFSLPLFFETQIILKIWLKIVPDSTVLFFRLGIIGTMFVLLGKTGYTACMATGKIKRYVFWITVVSCPIFPISYISYTLGAPVYTAYIVFIVVYAVIDFVRLKLMKDMLNFPIMFFFKDVLCRIFAVTAIAIPPPLLVVNSLESSNQRLILTCVISLISTFIGSILFGITRNERLFIITEIKKKVKKIGGG